MPAYKDEKRGTWSARFYYTDWQGKRKQAKKRGFEKKKDALEYEREFLAKAEQSCDMTFSSLAALYFEDMETRLRATTIDTKKHIFKTKLLPFFGDQPINEITPTKVRKWQGEMMKQGYAETYLKTLHNQLSAIFNFAVKYYNFPTNPVRSAGSMGKKKADSMDFWTLEEFEKFISEVDKPGMNLAFQIMFWTGLRVGETLALFPRDITPDKMINVCKTTSRKDGIDHFYDPKTQKSMRLVPIPDFLYDEIYSYINRLYGVQEDDQIFYFARSTLSAALGSYAKKAGVKRIRVHDLRHSHASLLIDMGQPILLVSERLGHESVETTWSTYAHLYPNKGVELADALQDLMEKTKEE
ncbi:MAG: site-specific integrase [Eubacteriales bacterium]